MKILQLAAMIAVFFSGSALADGPGDFVLNGGFSDQNECLVGTKNVTDWKIPEGTVSVFNATCNGGLDTAPYTGNYYVDLNGKESRTSRPGVLKQTIQTWPEQSYYFAFFFGGNALWQTPGNTLPNDGPIKAMAVYINGVLAGVYSVDTSKASSPTDGQWQEVFFNFTATSESTVIEFKSLNGSKQHPSDFGPLLQGVSVVI